MQSSGDLMEGTNGSIESRNYISTVISNKQKVFLLKIFWCDSLPKLTQGQLKRLSRDSVNRYLNNLRKLFSQDCRMSTRQHCEWHIQSFWVRKVALEVFKKILGVTIAILSQQKRVFFSFGFFPATNVTHSKGIFSENERDESFWSTKVFIYIVTFE